MLILILIVLTICILVGLYISTYNKIQDYIIKINEVEAIIDTNLRNKYDNINKSVSIIKANDKINKKIDKNMFEEVVRLRNIKISNFDLDRKLVGATNELYAIKESNKKEIKSEEINKIIKQLKDIDNRLDIYRNYYNSNIAKFNKMVKSFPTNIVALLCKYDTKLFFDMKNMEDDDVEDFKL